MIKQWELPNDSLVVLPSEEIVTFLKMDGAYAKWAVTDPTTGDREMATGNFKGFRKIEKGVYRVIE